jgi:mono/diheme cytochrome c family protein
MATTAGAYQRGVDFLLRTQFSDGSWWVRSRAWPFQPHFDSAFPHGRDQWISAGATAMAATALLFTVEPTVPPASLRDGRQLVAAFIQSSVTAATGESRETSRHSRLRTSSSPGAEAIATVDFARDIQPLFQRSCADCHGGTRPKAGFSVTTREALLKGGQNGEPAIVPGHADRSHLLLYVADKVEDLEMPPLNRREKFPALSAEEIARLRAWIDSGARWAEANPETASGS